MPLTTEQKQIISSTVPVLAEHGPAVTKLFYQTLLTEHPDLKTVFNHTAQATSQQPNALAYSLYAYAANINDLTPILGVVNKINHKHASLAIKPEHYPIVGEGVLRAFRTILGPDVFTDELWDAWLAAYNELADIMIKLEDNIYEQHLEEGGWKDFIPMKIVNKEKESDEITSFYLSPINGKQLPPFHPGQYISVKVDVPQFGQPQIRQYSLSKAPALTATSNKPTSQTNGHINGTTTPDLTSTYRISVKRDAGAPGHAPGFVSNVLHKTQNIGAIIEVSNPTGEFTLDAAALPPTAPIVLISAGVGITPTISMLDHLTSASSSSSDPTPRPISFIHTARSASTRAFAQTLTSLQATIPTLRSKIYHTAPHDSETLGVDYDIVGRFDIARLNDQERRELLHIHNQEAVYFVCGPERFMVDVERVLTGEMGVEAARVRMEKFGTGEIER